jgi:hypothetical protein
LAGLDVPTHDLRFREILEQFCIAIKRILGAGLTIEQSEAKLTAELTYLRVHCLHQLKQTNRLRKYW